MGNWEWGARNGELGMSFDVYYYYRCIINTMYWFVSVILEAMYNTDSSPDRIESYSFILIWCQFRNEGKM